LLKFSDAPVEISNDPSLKLVNQEKYLSIGNEGIHTTIAASKFPKRQEFGSRFFLLQH
jgi:hypothetical protein